METNWKFILQESETHYYCVICGYDLSGSQNAEGHFRARCHADTMEVYGGDISYTGDNQYYCQLCDCYISGYQNVRAHLRGQWHQDCLYGSDTETSEDDSENYAALSSRDFIIRYTDCNMFYCCLCNRNITDEWNIFLHLWSPEHITAVGMYGSDILGNGSTWWYYCRLCDCAITSYNNIYEHITGWQHDNFL